MSATVGNKVLFKVGEPTTTALASSTSVMTSLRCHFLRLMGLTTTPVSLSPSAMAEAIFSVLCHMVSYTSTALALVS